MKLVFAGTPEFSVAALDALHAAGHEIVAVYTQPDRPAGRGQKLTPAPVARRARELGLDVQRPPKLDADAQVQLRALVPDIMVVVAYGLLLPQAVLDIPRHGCLNIHASLLPRWRGAAPIARAIEAGDRESGITIMQMEAGLDTGPMLLKGTLPIGATTTAARLHDALAPLGAKLIVEALSRIAAGDLRATPQPAAGATYARKLSKDEARLDWTQAADVLARKVRAFNPAPVAWSTLDDDNGAGERVRFWNAEARAQNSKAAAGTVIDTQGDALLLATGDGSLAITQLQRPGGRLLAAAEALRSWNILGRKFN
ncbi:MAG: methionyl-tRNA formyltransferase [Nevskia sp.]|nr:methionyl-tRNA formyltransferase [Nevskia sp.]